MLEVYHINQLAVAYSDFHFFKYFPSTQVIFQSKGKEPLEVWLNENFVWLLSFIHFGTFCTLLRLAKCITFSVHKQDICRVMTVVHKEITLL